MTPYFETRAISLAYRGHRALADVSLTVPAGAITALVGPSGCGKSSLLATLNRLVDEIPGARVTGAVLAQGRDVREPGVDLAALRRRVGMIFQKPVPFPLSIRGNMTLPLRNHGLRDRRLLAEKVQEALEAVGLWSEVKDRLDAPAQSLSGGQQQRLCIARAISLDAEAFLFDEPCSALDPHSSAVVEELIHSLRGRYTVVIVTHNLAQARRIADHAAILWAEEGAGRLVAAGPAAEVLEAPAHPMARAFVTGKRG